MLMANSVSCLRVGQYVQRNSRQTNTYLPISTLRVEWSDMATADAAVYSVCVILGFTEKCETRRKEVVLLTAEMRGQQAGTKESV